MSVILTNYNHGALVRRALEALVAQDYASKEIIVVDDGSTDDSEPVIRQFAERNPEIHIIVNPKNLGTVAAQNIGIRAANGRYIAFAAADDWVLPGYFTCAIKMLEAYPQVGLFCAEVLQVDRDSGATVGVRPIVRPLQRAGAVEASQVRHLLARIDNWILTSSTVFRREIMQAVGGLDARFGSFADGVLIRKIALRHGFFFSPRPVATWTIDARSFSRRTALDIDRAQRALETIPEMIAADPDFPPWYAQRFADRWRFATSRLALDSTPVDRELLRAMGSRSRLDRIVIDLISTVPIRRLAKLATLGWLWFRLRPTTLTGLARTALARKLENLLPRERSSTSPG